MGQRIAHKLNNLLFKAVVLIANSLDLDHDDIGYRYKASIAYFYKLLAIIYLEKEGLIPDKLHKQINYIHNINSCQFNNIIEYQLRYSGIKNLIFADFPVQINHKYFPEFVEIIKELSHYKLDIESFGYLYEDFQQYRLIEKLEDSRQLQLQIDIKPNYQYELVPSDTSRKKQGSFYTPPQLIDYLINSGLDEKLKEISSIGEILQFKVLDPACGGGNVLLKVFNALYNKGLERLNQSISPDDLRKLILKNCVFGIDIDDFACNITKLTLFLASGKLDHFDNIISGNFLIHNLPDYPHNIDLSGFIADNSNKFSLIIGNPPYLNIQNINEKEKKYYLDNYSSAFRRFDIYLLFIEKSLQTLLKDGGTLTFIIPDKFLTQSYATKLRKLILNNHTIKEVIQLKKHNLFKNASVFPIIIAIIRGKQKHSDIRIRDISADNSGVKYINQDLFYKMYDLAYRIDWNTHLEEIIEQIQSKSFPLYELCYVSWGAQPGNAKKFIFTNNQIDSSFREHLKPLIRGGNLSRYNISYSGDHLLYLVEGDLKLHRPAFPELFESEKIIIAEVTAQKGIVASLDADRYYTNHSIINCIHKKSLIDVKKVLTSRGIKIIDGIQPTESYKWQEDQQAYTRGSTVYKQSKFNDIDIKYALSIINSNLINFYFKSFLSGELNVFPELVRFLPIYDLKPVDSTHSVCSYFTDILNNNKFSELEEVIETLINDQNHSDIHDLFSLIAVKLIEFKQNLAVSNFIILDNILEEAVYKLYGFNRNQINYMKEKSH